MIFNILQILHNPTDEAVLDSDGNKYTKSLFKKPLYLVQFNPLRTEHEMEAFPHGFCEYKGFS